MAFKIGDTVELKSGGPTMTVSALRGKDEVTCQWFNNEGTVFKLQQDIFHVETLKPAK